MPRRRQITCHQVETEGHLTRGMTVFDLRYQPLWLSNIDVAVKIDSKAMVREIITGLNAAAEQVERQ